MQSTFTFFPSLLYFSELFILQVQYENENFNLMTNVLYTAEGILRANKRMNIKCPNVNRNVGKLWWTNVYFNWDNEQFQSKFRLTKDNFIIILNKIEASIIKTPTYLVPEPVELNRQLGLTIYKLAHGCTFWNFRVPCNSNL